MGNKYKFEIGIVHNGVKYMPLVQDGATLTSNYRGVPSEFNFTVLKTPELDFAEGDAVLLEVNGVKMFFGFVFEKQRTDNETISVKAYDQMRYLQCRDNIEFSPRTASQYVEHIAKLTQIRYGEIEDTKHVLPDRVEESTSYVDMILGALERTKKISGEEYILYDDFGSLTLKNVDSLVANCYISADNTESFNYTTSIDKDTYTKVRLVRSNGREKDTPEYIAKDEESIKKWGVLVYYEKLDDNDNATVKAKELLRQYNRKTVTLSLKNVFGNAEVRAGKSVLVDLDLGDMKLRQFLLVTKCTHTFSQGEHFMHLDLKGGVINE